jgi:hypothetical protein
MLQPWSRGAPYGHGANSLTPPGALVEQLLVHWWIHRPTGQPPVPCWISSGSRGTVGASTAQWLTNLTIHARYTPCPWFNMLRLYVLTVGPRAGAKPQPFFCPFEPLTHVKYEMCHSYNKFHPSAARLARFP